MTLLHSTQRDATRFPSSQVLWKVGDPATSPHRLTVVSKVTYALKPGRSEPCAAQEPIVERDDLVPYKPRTDVLVVGDTQAVARVTVGNIAKRAPTGAARSSPPAPLSGVWSLPGGFDLGAFNVAPGDQQGATILPTDLAIRVEPVWPGGPNVTTTLVPVSAKAILQSPDFMDAIVLEIDTVVVDVERMLCVVTMRGSRVLPGAPDKVATNLAFDVAPRVEDTTSDARPSPVPALPFDERRRGTMEMVLPPQLGGPALPSYLRATAPVRVELGRVDGLPFGRDPGASAATSGAVAASNEAARAAIDHAEIGTPSIAREPRDPSTSSVPPALADAIELLWFDAARAPDLQQSPLAPIFGDGVGKRGLIQGKVELDEPTRVARGMFRVLTSAATTSTSELDVLLAQGNDARDGAAPFAVFDGELTLSFDERDWMRVALATLAPAMQLDPELKRVGDAARAIVDDPWAPARVLLPARSHLRASYERTHRDGEGLDALVHRELLERRSFKRRVILGEERLRVAFSTSRNEPAIPAYLSSSAAPMLPLYERFPVRLLCEARRKQDALEAHTCALVVVAVARRHTV